MFIRKISVGPDYVSGGMHYVYGQTVLGTWKIHLIKPCEKTGNYKIYIENKNEEILLWKEFSSTMPISIEYNINI